jgi:MoxR-like ATPase
VTDQQHHLRTVRDGDASERAVERAAYEIRRVIAGQDALLERTFVALLAGGHLLIEGVPRPREDADDQDHRRRARRHASNAVQFTPTSCRPDLVGTRVYRPGRREFDTELGPVFCNFLLADEINRAPGRRCSRRCSR